MSCDLSIMTYDSRFYVLFVCTGNICRSPMAHGLLEAELAAAELRNVVRVDSAATHSYQIGSPPARPACELVAEHGIDISGLRARRIQPQDFINADYIVAMDRLNIDALHAVAPADQLRKIQLLLDFAGRPGSEIDDPYMQPVDAYRQAFSLIQAGVSGVLRELQRRTMATSAGGR